MFEDIVEHLKELKKGKIPVIIILLSFLLTYVILAIGVSDFVWVGNHSRIYDPYYSIDVFYSYLPAKCLTQIPRVLASSTTEPFFAVIIFPLLKTFPLGLLTVRIINSIFATGSLFFVYRICREMNLERSFSILGTLLAGTSAVFFLMSFSGLSAVPFTFFLLASLYFYSENKFLLSAVFTSFLPMLRTEGLLVLILMVFVYLKKRRERLLFVIFSPLLIWFAYSQISTGNFFYPYAIRLPRWFTFGDPGKLLHGVQWKYFSKLRVVSNFISSIGLVSVAFFSLGVFYNNKYTDDGGKRSIFLEVLIVLSLFFFLTSAILDRTLYLRYFYSLIPFIYIFTCVGLKQLYSRLSSSTNELIVISALTIVIFSMLFINFLKINDEELEITKTSILRHPSQGKWDEYKNDLVELRNWIDTYQKKNKPDRIYGPWDLYILDIFDNNKECRFWNGFYVYDSHEDLIDLAKTNKTTLYSYYTTPPPREYRLKKNSLMLFEKTRNIRNCQDISGKMNKVKEFQELNLTACRYK